MIARLTGRIEHVAGASALVDVGGGICYEVLVPAGDAGRLSSRAGQTVTFHTIHILEGDPTRGGLTPRLIGFLGEEDRAFFQAFTTVKGIGIRKALRALAQPMGEIAAAIENKDAKFLVALPEIGKRTAETIIASLHGKVATFATAGASAGDAAPTSTLGEAGQEALAVLIQLGERRGDAEALVQRVTAVAPELDTAEAIIQHAYRLKAGG